MPSIYCDALPESSSLEASLKRKNKQTSGLVTATNLLIYSCIASLFLSFSIGVLSLSLDVEATVAAGDLIR